MDLANLRDDILRMGYVVWQPDPGVYRGTFFVKGTFALVPGEPARPLDGDEPGLPSGDVHDDEDDERPLRYSTDFAPYKTRADVLVVGAGHAPRARARPWFDVRVRVGPIHKVLTVIGDRRWERRRLRRPRIPEPEHIVSMPIGWDRAYGGSRFGRNPLGRGHGDSDDLPNVEWKTRPLRAPDDDLDPAGFGPLGGDWEPRRRMLGTYKGAWAKTRWPCVPDDFDRAYFNAAPEDQQVEGFLVGDEEIELENLHPEHENLRTRLPGIRARCALRERPPEGSPEEGDREGPVRDLDLVLDTVWIDAAALRVVLVWRGSTDLEAPGMKEIAEVAIDAERLEDPRRDARAILADVAERERLEDAAFEAEFEEDDEGAGAAGPVTTGLDPEDEAEIAEIEKEFAEADAVVDQAEAEARAGALRSDEVTPATIDGPAPAYDMLTELRPHLDELARTDAPLAREFEEAIREAQDLERTMASGGAALGIDSVDPGALAELEAAEELEADEGVPEDPSLLAGRDLSGADLSGRDLAGVSLVECDLAGADLAGASLEGADLTEADLTGANLSGANLRGAILHEAMLTDATLAGAVLAGASLTDTDLEGVDLAGLDLSGCRGEAPDLSKANLEGADLRGTSLVAPDLSGAVLDGADLRGALLHDADLSEASAVGARFGGADLTGARGGTGADLSGADLTGVRAPGSVWQECRFAEADLSGSDFTGAEFDGAELPGARIDRGVLTGASFADAVLAGAVVTNTNLLRVAFDRADLTRARIERSNAYEAGFFEAVVDDLVLDDTNLKQTLLADS